MNLKNSIEHLIYRKNIAQSKEIAGALTFCGGFIDAYTYIQRGHTLAAGQTGNVIFFSASVAQGNVSGIINRLSTIISFILGLIIVTLIHAHSKSHYWRIFEMLPIILICGIVSFLPKTIPNYYIVPALAIGLSMQNGAFRKIEGVGYSNGFTSGNLKKATLAWSQYFFANDKSQRATGENYLILVIAFVFGAMISAFLQKIMGIHTLLIAMFLLIIINSFYGYLVYKRHKNWLNGSNTNI